MENLKIGAKVIIYTVIMRGNAQTSYVGNLLEINQYGVIVETTGGKAFYPWSAIERLTF